MLLALAKALGVKVAYFFKSAPDIALTDLEYRKRAVSKKEIASIKAKVLEQVERRVELEMLYWGRSHCQSGQLA